MTTYSTGTMIVAEGRKRCVRIAGIITDHILGGYQVLGSDGLRYYVRHSDFEIKEVKK